MVALVARVELLVSRYQVFLYHSPVAEEILKLCLFPFEMTVALTLVMESVSREVCILLYHRCLYVVAMPFCGPDMLVVAAVVSFLCPRCLFPHHSLQVDCELPDGKCHV